MEKAIQLFIFIHAFGGGIALISGFLSLVFQKGKSAHKITGLLFYYAMLLCGLSALCIAVLPHHESPFLFAVGIFSLYFVISGRRALLYKNKHLHLTIDTLIAATMIITGILMIVLPIILHHQLHIVLTVFAIVGITFSVRDLFLIQHPDRLRKGWLKLHLGKMIGGYIAATTAFVVVNNFFPGFYSWFIPGIIGSIVIAYWMRKVSIKA
ncbi:DUF2306 domain-containing protein [Zhouia sp. PK063]|uniref:DUF2306 domain-containing protein n=1 Tax=Zhouia sp. PK063 TaxID=3373602 RepID=UPI00379E9E33